MRFATAAIIGALAVIAITALTITFRNEYSDAGPVIRSVCLSNLKQQGVAMAIYVEANDGLYPPSHVHQSRPKNVDTLTCPTLQRKGVVGGYALNSDLLLKPRGSSPATTVVFFERDGALPGDSAPLNRRSTSRHGAGSNVVYEDGRAASLANP